MKILSRITLTLATAATLAAIWTPYWWQFALTALVLLFAGAALAATADKPPHSNSTGPHMRFTANGYSSNETTEHLDQKRRQHETLNRPTYGKSHKENNQ